MNAITYVQNVGKTTPTVSSSVINTTKKFFDPDYEKEQESKRSEHARMMHSFLFGSLV